MTQDITHLNATAITVPTNVQAQQNVPAMDTVITIFMEKCKDFVRSKGDNMGDFYVCAGCHKSMYTVGYTVNRNHFHNKRCWELSKSW